MVQPSKFKLEFQRFELKVTVPVSRLNDIRTYLLNYMIYDQYSMKMADRTYEVLSLYFDTPELKFYHEKMSGNKYRKKLRIRDYPDSPGENVFFEVKNKINDIIYKQRVPVERQIFADVLHSKVVLAPENPKSRKNLNDFLFYINRFQLEPTLLVKYRREAFMDQVEQKVRVTFDTQIESLPQSELELYPEESWDVVTSSQAVIEIKFNGLMPYWIKELIKNYQLKVDSFSKYCQGVEESMLVYR